MLQLEKYIRKLARSTYYQLLYTSTKELGISLFENRKNLSGIQLIFLYWLRLYSSLYEDLSMGMSEYLDREVIEDDLRTEAFLLLRKRESRQEIRERNKMRIKSKLKGNPENVEETTFRRRR